MDYEDIEEDIIIEPEDIFDMENTENFNVMSNSTKFNTIINLIFISIEILSELSRIYHKAFWFFLFYLFCLSKIFEFFLILHNILNVKFVTILTNNFINLFIFGNTSLGINVVLV